MIAAEKLLGCLAFVACCAVPSLAHADDRADALFKEGRQLLDAKKYDEACAKLSQSQEIEPGAGTLVALSMCHEGQNKTATAHRELTEAAAMGKKKGRNDLAAAATKRAAQLEPTLSKIVVRAGKDAPEDLEVRLDEKPLPKDELGGAIAVDPGEHKVVASAKGKKPKSYTVRLTGAGTTEIVVERLDDQAKVAPVLAPRPAPREETAPPDEQPGRGGVQRAIGVVMMTGSLVGYGLGGYFGANALSEQQKSDKSCGSRDGVCRAEAETARESAKSSFNNAVLSAGIGTGALAIGAIIYFTAPRGSASEPSRGSSDPPKRSARVIPEAGPDRVGLGLSGTF